MTWLVTGSAGYLGSHVCLSMLKNGQSVLGIDSLINSDESRMLSLMEDFPRSQFIFRKCDISSQIDIEILLKELDLKVEGIIHLAALKSVPESFREPALYETVNVNFTEQLISLAKSLRIKKFIFASTAAVYRANTISKLKETDLLDPNSPYGKSKLNAEKKLIEFGELNDISVINLRIFNLVGTATRKLVDKSTDNLIPKVINSILTKNRPVIFGKNYNTLDGTCVRDYVDVRDASEAVVQVTNRVERQELPHAINIGSGIGHSVLQVISEIYNLIDLDINPMFKERREGDVAKVVADITLAEQFLEFKPKFNFALSMKSLEWELTRG